jgi:16S rRNA processing protein RimM
MDESELIVIGRIVKAHGLRGEVVVRPSSPGSDVLFHVSPVILETGGRNESREILRGREQGQAVVLALEGVTDRNAAEALVGSQLLLKKRDLPPPSDDEVYIDSLMGLIVVSPTGELLGKVVGFEDGGMQSWLVVERKGREVLVPFTEPLIKIELEAARIILDAPDGLLDPDGT